MTEALTIRSLTTTTELEDVRALESRVWGEEEATPVHQTLTAVKNGGLVLGAFSDEKLIGFQYSFPGFDGTCVYLCSHILAVDPAYRSMGIGAKLKYAQRQESKKKGYSYISWTYDPLESANGYLNIGKLGAVCSTYIENCYGDMNDPLNANLPSDRFVVEWASAKDTKRAQPTYTPDQIMDASLIQWTLTDEGFPSVTGIDEKWLDHDVVSVAIPSAFQQMKEVSPSLALDWRMRTRRVFQTCFAKGFEVTNFMKYPESSASVHFYILTKKEVQK
ncbi:GNAT family N-acetyltransferase [Priestia megaterium]|uniref:GNAT family N-acetyltransferase n=1 Tax=Priestia megaterium TaxID=1404 RepID=UPI0013E29176|nr:GNAT family N-acetyltransferase [Priestia megaterium]MED3865177.1 GNAT family N-acetyltransferase [Priestia megaterium]MED4100526.1 GNAT family N-acetyltransferase [Priestia megaterium]MED4144423.1 GNAT family N-acetyltransferase [Priestia megaterium]MED4165722.1 GNAT family N-acetyltransferase [Priestia megaterium]MED4198132.1 GNAT family N-acetyltransferase [Priestia megaterium]